MKCQHSGCSCDAQARHHRGNRVVNGARVGTAGPHDHPRIDADSSSLKVDSARRVGGTSIARLCARQKEVNRIVKGSRAAQCPRGRRSHGGLYRITHGTNQRAARRAITCRLSADGPGRATHTAGCTAARRYAVVSGEPSGISDQSVGEQWSLIVDSCREELDR